ncbi:MAG: zinc ribbon domain-containing protein, partial [Candidatus Hydrothermarchaeales archaeon]
MKCRSCGAELEGEWSFCPRCGVKRGQEFGRGMEDIMELFERSLKDIFSGGFPMNFPFGKGFMVEISQESGSPTFSVKEFGSDAMKEQKEEVLSEVKEIPKDSKVVEPKISLKGKRTIEVHLPGVKAKDDIHIKKFHDSLEI